MTRAERDRLIADQHLIITLADGVCGRAYENAEIAYDRAVEDASDARAAAERSADNVFYPIKKEAEAEIARLEGLEVTE